MARQNHNVFVTGGTGYLGRFLLPQLIARGHTVAALTRAGSEGKLPTGANVIQGNALDRLTFEKKIKPADTFIQLVGVPHPSPAKAAQFRSIDLVSVRESVQAAKQAGIRHFIYLSVAQPAPIMKAYLAVRAEGEEMIRQSGMSATFIRPFYVLGPGHWWPYAILPAFWIFGLFPKWRDGARRLKPVKLASTVTALVDAVENPPDQVRIVDAPEISGLALD